MFAAAFKRGVGLLEAERVIVGGQSPGEGAIPIGCGCP